MGAMATMGRAQAAAAVVRRLNAAVKSFRIYAPGHPIRAEALSAFMESVQGYNERFGSFVLETHRTGLLVEGKPFEGGESIDNLARILYAIGVWQLVWLPGTTEAEVKEVLIVLLLDRETILAQGGFFEALTRRSVQHVRVIELRPGELDPTGISLDTYMQLLDGSLSPQDRAAILGLLRLGPPQTRMLITVIADRTRQAFPYASGKELAERVYAALTALDRLIVEVPPGESSILLKNLADSVVELDKGRRGELDAMILARASEDLSARALLSAMTPGQIARLVMLCLEASASSDPIAQVVKGLPLDPEKVREVVTLIEAQTGQAFNMPPVREELTQPRWIHNIQHDLADFQVSVADLKVWEEEMKALVAEARIDEQALAQERAFTLLRLALEEHDPRELYANLDALVETIAAMLHQGHYAVLTTVMPELGTLTLEGGPRAEAGRAALSKILAAIYGMLTVKEVWLWDHTEPLLVCLRRVGTSAAALLAESLRTEREPTRRQVITAIVTKLGDQYVETLAAYLNDSNLEVVRNIIHALVNMRTGRSFATLQVVARHPDLHMRREAVEALGAATLVEAQQALLAFLRDPDPQIRGHSLLHLRAETAHGAIDQLVGMLQDRALAHHPDLKLQVIDILQRINAQEALPVLRRLASPFRLRKRDRVVAGRAREAIAALSRMPTGSGASHAREALS